MSPVLLSSLLRCPGLVLNLLGRLGLLQTVIFQFLSSELVCPVLGSYSCWDHFCLSVDNSSCFCVKYQEYNCHGVQQLFHLPACLTVVSQLTLSFHLDELKFDVSFQLNSADQFYVLGCVLRVIWESSSLDLDLQSFSSFFPN